MRRAIFALVFAATAVTTSVTQAGWTEFWEGVHLDWHRMNCWPEPFVHADRDLVRQPLLAMTDNGWRMQNTLSDHLFDVEKNTLTQAGALKVRWIVTQAPPHRRTVFVLRGASPDATLARVEAVQESITQLVPQGARPEVLLTDVIPVGGSGDYFDAVDRALKDSIPPPRLPEASGPTGSGGN
ncbi:MAG: hypothetical protein H6821_01570 [Planctomycetaceae bacterium]|nr:hypothetical protein [Planctomycetales bacterium]MCB9872841.1 hypothetical protein [Planctomycetaceae bacterium]MCB9941410.1 hypothetical protein [Planctomycetaceae bacterium]HRX80142.1 hypothetical protein [Pirellulaceae bacterium]